MDRARVAVLVAGVVTAAASVAAIVAAATSSDSDAGGANVATATTTVEANGSLAIEIRDFAFGPDGPSVTTGTPVTWTNADAVAHSISSADGSFDSPVLDEGATFTFVFNEAGTYPYVCGIHNQMQGTITVEG